MFFERPDSGARVNTRQLVLPLILMMAAFWPVWRWLAVRVMQDSGDAWLLLSLAGAILWLWKERQLAVPFRARWLLPVLLIALYAASYPFAPPLARAMVAMCAVASALSSVWFGRLLDIRLLGLLLASLPVVPTMNFYLGYPLRVVVGEIVAALLQMNGFAAVRDGSMITWNGQQVAIDAPCSGVRMLWAGLYLSVGLAALHQLDTRKTVLLVTFGLGVVVLANVLRAAALFYMETGLVPGSGPAHTAVGLVVFGLGAGAIAAAAARQRVVCHAG